MPSTPRCLVWVILLLAAAPPAVCQGQELPPDALALVNTLEKETAAARQRYTDEFAAWRQRIREQLKAVQKTLADEDRLEEAILARDLAKVFATGKKPPLKYPPNVYVPRLRSDDANPPDVNFAEPVTGEEFAALPKEAQGVLLENEYPGSEKDYVEAAMREPSAELYLHLVELKAKYTKGGKLDEALAIRNWMAANLKAPPLPQPPPVEIVKPIIPDITEGAKDFAAIEANHAEALRAATAYLNHVQARSLAALLEKLQPLQGVYAQAERLDDALAVRELVRKLQAPQAPSARIALLSASRDQLPDEAKQQVASFLEAMKPVTKEWEDAVKNLDAQLLKPLKARAVAALNRGDVPGAREALTALYYRRNELFPYQETHQERLVIADEVQATLDAYREAARKLVDAADADDAARREALLAKLKEAQTRNLKFDEEMALDRSIRYLESPEFGGIRGTLLFLRNPDLKGDLAELVAAYVKESRAAYRALAGQHREAFEEFAPRLQEVRAKQVEAEDWKGAFSTLLTLQAPPGVVEPIPVALYRFPFTGGVEAMVVGIKDGLYQIRSVHHGLNWALREEICIGGEKAPDVVHDNENGPPPGVAVSRQAELQPGQLLVTKKGGWKWDVVQVIEAGVDTVKVRYTDRTNWEEEIERAKLRTIPEE